VYLAASEAMSALVAPSRDLPAAPQCARAPMSLVTHVAGPAETFTTIYDAYARFVWRALVRLGVADRDVEDLVQEVFLVVHRRASEFRQESTARTWVYGIAVHLARNYRRTGVRRPSDRPRRDASVNAGNDAGVANHETDALVEAPERAPDALLAKAEAAQLLVRLLQELDQDSREVFVLAELEEMTAVEIGEVLALSPNTVSSRLRAARRAFDEAVRRNRARDEWRLR
jgi:RNA polymerase sigma-70 factor (ECF subfamily)